MLSGGQRYLISCLVQCKENCLQPLKVCLKLTPATDWNITPSCTTTDLDTWASLQNSVALSVGSDLLRRNEDCGCGNGASSCMCSHVAFRNDPTLRATALVFLPRGGKIKLNFWPLKLQGGSKLRWFLLSSLIVRDWGRGLIPPPPPVRV